MVAQNYISLKKLQAYTNNTSSKEGKSILSKKIIRPIRVYLYKGTFATRLIENGADIKTVQELLGHENIQTRILYVDSNPVRLKKIQAALSI